MEFIKKHLYTLVLIALAIIVTFVYLSFFTNDDEEAKTLTTQTGEGALTMETKDSKNVVGKDLLNLLLKLKDVELEGSVLENKMFLELNDYSRDIEDQSIGRQNPFSSI